MKNQFIYRLRALALNVYNKRIKKNRDGSINVTQQNFGCYTSERKAENALKTFLKNQQFYQCLYGGFIIYKEKLNDKDQIEFIHNNVYYGIKTFDRFGNYNSCGHRPSDKNYTGSNSKFIKFNTGDKFYYYMEPDLLIPEVVIYKPYTKKEWRKLFGKNKDVQCDYSEDCYLSINATGHNHPQLALAFPFFGILTKKEKKAIKKSAKIYFEKQYYQDNIGDIIDKA